MTPNKAHLILMAFAMLWAISGILIIVNYLERDFTMMAVYVILMVLNATHYTLIKKQME